MSPDAECRLIVALNLFPWQQGRLTDGDKTAPTYCAIGALLRYAGVDREEMQRSDICAITRHLGLLRMTYGVSVDLCLSIIQANDTSGTRDEVIGRVRDIMNGGATPGDAHASGDEDAGALVALA